MRRRCGRTDAVGKIHQRARLHHKQMRIELLFVLRICGLGCPDWFGGGIDAPASSGLSQTTTPDASLAPPDLGFAFAAAPAEHQTSP